MIRNRRSFGLAAIGAAAASSLALKRVSGHANPLAGEAHPPSVEAAHVQLRQGPAVRDPYAGVPGPTWWKGQLHTHTARSYDGDPTVSPATRAAQYQAADYDFALLTDHDRVSIVPTESLPTGPSGHPFLALPGVESTHPQAHLGIWLVGEEATAAVQDKPIISSSRPPADRMEAWAAAGALVCCNHPSHVSAPLTAEQVESWAGGGVPFRFVEVFNTLATRTGDEVDYNAEVWRRAITAAGPERPVWGVASDDSHGQSVGQGWIEAASASLTPGALREALAAGRFYASSGLAFSHLGVDPEANGLVAAAPGAATIRFVADDGTVHHQVSGETGLYRPDGSARWIRIEAIDVDGRTAWSQPFWIDS